MTRVLLVVVGLCVSMPAHAEDTKRPEDTNTAGRKDFNKKAPLDRDFLAVASEGANCGSSLAALAEKRASRQDVKDFAKKLDKDHKALLNDLAEVIKNRKVAIVAGTSKNDREMCANVGKLEGKDFETRFLKEVTDRLERAIAMCENQVKNGKDKEISTFAQNALPTLREDLKQARKLQA